MCGEEVKECTFNQIRRKYARHLALRKQLKKGSAGSVMTTSTISSSEDIDERFGAMYIDGVDLAAVCGKKSWRERLSSKENILALVRPGHGNRSVSVN